MTLRTLFTWTIGLLLAAVPLVAEEALAAPGPATLVVGLDEWGPDSMIAMGDFSCAAGDLQTREVPGSPFPLPYCLEGEGPLRWTGGEGWACFTTTTLDSVPESDFTGVAYMTLGAELDPTHDANPAYVGPVGGEWMLVPHPACGTLSRPEALAVLEGAESFWRGRWSGARTLICETGSCSWLGSIVLSGKGRGGALAGSAFTGAETVQTFSPLPFPYEVVGLCGPGAPCPAEGHLTGLLKRR